MEALGRLFNVVPTADAVEVSLRDATGVTFICVGADTYTIAEAQDAAGTGAQSLPGGIERWYTNSAAVGATTWALATDDTPAAAVVVAANAAIYVGANQLSAGFDYVRCTSTSTGLVVAIVHDLVVQRDPANLPALAL